jgi:cysteine synthase B
LGAKEAAPPLLPAGDECRCSPPSKNDPAIQVIGLQPDAPFHGLEGLKHMDTAILPGIYDPGLADRQLSISTEVTYRMARRLAREEGLLVGISSAAAMVGALQVAQELADQHRPGVVVTIFPDNASKYLNEPFWTEETD